MRSLASPRDDLAVVRVVALDELGNELSPGDLKGNEVFRHGDLDLAFLAERRWISVTALVGTMKSRSWLCGNSMSLYEERQTASIGGGRA